MRLDVQKSLDSERIVLQCALHSADLWAIARDTVQPDHFYGQQHGEIWAAALAVDATGATPDLKAVTVQLELSGQLNRAGGREYLSSLTDVIPITSVLEHHGKRIADLSSVRALQAAALEIAQEASEPVEDTGSLLDRAEVAIGKVCERGGQAGQAVHITVAIDEVVKRIVRQAEEGRPAGHKTGVTGLDWYLGGMVPGELVVLAARPGMGKSALAGAIGEGVARYNGMPVLVSSLEMARELWALRMLSAEAGVDSQKMRAARLSREDWSAIHRSADELGRLGIYIDDRTDANVLDFRREARRLKSRLGKLGLVVVDYLQLAQSIDDDRSREREVAIVSRGLKALAKELHVPVLALSQLNRRVDDRNDKRPQLSDLRESGAIEQDADTVLFIYRDDVYDRESEDKGTAEIIIGKQRSGPTGWFRMLFRREYTRFENLAEWGQEQ